MLQKRIGAPPPELVEQYGLRKADRMMKPFMRWADAIVITPEELLIVEGKIRSTPAVVGQLEFYVELVKKTPDLQLYMDRRIVPVLLTPWADIDLVPYAESRGIRVEYYHPPWIDEYLREIQGYREAPAVERRMLEKEEERRRTE